MSFNVLISAIAHTSVLSSPCRGCVSDLSQVWCVLWFCRLVLMLRDCRPTFISTLCLCEVSSCAFVHLFNRLQPWLYTKPERAWEAAIALVFSSVSEFPTQQSFGTSIFHLNTKVQSSDIKQLSLLRSLRLQFNMYCEELWLPFADAPLYICLFICKNHVFSCFTCLSFTAWMVVSSSVASKTEETRRSQKEVRNARTQTHTQATVITNVKPKPTGRRQIRSLLFPLSKISISFFFFFLTIGNQWPEYLLAKAKIKAFTVSIEGSILSLL